MAKKILLFLLLITTIESLANNLNKTKVKIVEAKISNIYNEYISVGECRNIHGQDFYANGISGLITEVSKNQGGEVKAGDIILKIDGPLAEAEFQSAKLELERNKLLLQKSFISTSEFEKIKLSFEQARKNYQARVIIAPFDGIIGSIEYEIGDKINAGDYLISITNGKQSEFIVNLPEKLIPSINKDTKTLLLFNNEYIDGAKITSVSSYLNKDTGSFLIKILAPDNISFIHGSYTKIKFLLNPHDAIIIPEQAVMKNNKGNFVFVITDGNLIKENYIELGIRNGDDIEVIKGLSENDKIVIEGLTKIRDGSLVEVIE